MNIYIIDRKFVTVQSQANLIKICVECLHSPRCPGERKAFFQCELARYFIILIWRIRHMEETRSVFEIGFEQLRYFNNVRKVMYRLKYTFEC